MFYRKINRCDGSMKYLKYRSKHFQGFKESIIRCAALVRFSFYWNFYLSSIYDVDKSPPDLKRIILCNSLLLFNHFSLVFWITFPDKGYDEIQNYSMKKIQHCLNAPIFQIFKFSSFINWKRRCRGEVLSNTRKMYILFSTFTKQTHTGDWVRSMEWCDQMGAHSWVLNWKKTLSIIPLEMQQHTRADLFFHFGRPTPSKKIKKTHFS